MIIFLEKIRVKTIFSIVDPVKVEPLELCYLKTILNNMNIESYIIDDLFGFKEPQGLIPNIIVLTGYNTAENEIIKKSKIYKNKYPQAKIIVGGVHIQENAAYFRVDTIDYVVHSGSLNTFVLLIKKIKNNDNIPLDKGVDTFQKNGWHLGEKESINEIENIKPDRGFFSKAKSKFKYLDKRNVALIKGSVGCPFKCSYCYCKLLNNKHYIKPSYQAMIEEMESLDADYYWIIDDVLFSSRDDALKFIEIIEKKKIKLKIIGYLRADFICKEQDLLKRLKEVGLCEVIVGFEATDNKELENYKKTTDATDYPLAISLLKENKIDLTALFMVHPNYSFKDFKILNNFIKENQIDVYTISIMTPIKGTILYDEMKNELIEKRPEKFDFLHLVLKSKLPKFIFYILFYNLHISLLKSNRIKKFIKREI